MIDIQLPAGQYYVGDLCYIMNYEDWQNFTFSCNDENVLWTFKGSLCAWGYTVYGDGEYSGSDNLTYDVDSGTIGIFQIKDTSNFDIEEAKKLGNVITFDKPFNVEIREGFFKFDNLIIDTN